LSRSAPEAVPWNILHASVPADWGTFTNPETRTQNISVTRSTLDALIAEAESVPVAGWDFSWLEGRATEERPSWGYARMLVSRVAGAASALDVQTGGGEVFAEVVSRVDDRT
jgi:hypothetical protein